MSAIDPPRTSRKGKEREVPAPRDGQKEIQVTDIDKRLLAFQRRTAGCVLARISHRYRCSLWSTGRYAKSVRTGQSAPLRPRVPTGPTSPPNYHPPPRRRLPRPRRHAAIIRPRTSSCDLPKLTRTTSPVVSRSHPPPAPVLGACPPRTTTVQNSSIPTGIPFLSGALQSPTLFRIPVARTSRVVRSTAATIATQVHASSSTTRRTILSSSPSSRAHRAARSRRPNRRWTISPHIRYEREK